MKKNLFSAFIVSVAVLCILVITGGFSSLQPKPWPVPAANQAKKNPVASNAESIAEGKTLYATHCKSCHGTKGLGDGSKAATLKTDPGDFSKASFQSQTDGSIFYKTAEGRNDMPAYKKKISDADDIWSIVNFIRTLKK